jgi:quinoprotein glucose dehydrogenase
MLQKIIVYPIVAGAVATVLLSAAEQSAKPYKPFIAPASEEGKRAAARIRVPKEFKVDLWAAEPDLANPVCLWIDNKNRIYVAETFRLHAGVTDIRGHMDWLDDDLACRTVEDRIAMMKKKLGKGIKDSTVEHERIRLLEKVGGKIRSTVFADGFNRIEDGIAAGILARGDHVYYTCLPDLWLLKDPKNTGKASSRRKLHSGFGIHVGFLGHDMHGLTMGPDGKLYFSIGDRGLNVKTKDRTLAYPDTGCVLRCNLDGTELEVFAKGLRNPQELAFDDFGNLFTGDNNSDAGDQARWVYLVEGGDSGWRIGYQFGSVMGPRGPFMAEDLWKPAWSGQAAYIVPPIANVADGPSGLAYYPGVGLPDRYKNHFFLCDFRGGPANSGVRSFTLKNKGASYELAGQHEFIWSVLATDVDFGTDGAIYLTDWVDGWNKPGKGRIYKVENPDGIQSAAAQEAKKVLAEGMKGRKIVELGNLLGHASRRVRQEAQFALADRPKEAMPELTKIAQKDKRKLARLHAIWGLGQIARKDTDAAKPLLDLLADNDADVRAQTAKVLGDGKRKGAAKKLLALLHDEEPRVRFQAAQALANIADKGSTKSLIGMIRENDDKDAYLRHAGVRALAACASAAELIAATRDSSAAVRRAALLAWRQQESPEVTRFLDDTEPSIVLEAARAIHDVPIEKAQAPLASLIQRTDLAPLLGYRVLNANFRQGKGENARAVARFAARRDVSEPLRLEAIRMLGDWAKPNGKDRVMGLWRPLPARPGPLAADAMRTSLGAILTGPDAVRKEAIKVAANMGIKDIKPTLISMLQDKKQAAGVRVEALTALASFNDSSLFKVEKTALNDTEPGLRAEARHILARRNPKEALPHLAKALVHGTLLEKQRAFATLAAMKDEPAARLIDEWLDLLLKNKVPAEVRLDLLEAAEAKSGKDIKDKLRRLEGARPKSEPFGQWRHSLVGGDAERGRQIFFFKAAVSCVRCHKVEGQGGDVGPDLTGIAGKQKRDYLLESIVDPNKQIAKGYETIVLTLSNGKSVAGILKKEDAKEVQLMTPDGALVVVPVRKIEQRQKGKSSMPDDLVQKLSRTEMRDLVEFLASLKTAEKKR